MTNPRITEILAQIADLGVHADAFDRGVNEGAEGHNPYTAKIEILTDEMLTLRIAEARTAREAEWTRDVTVARRAEWNAFVRSVNTAKGVPAQAVRDQQTAQGWTTDDLRTAIARHGL